jgi:hypothetical protein
LMMVNPLAKVAPLALYWIELLVPSRRT